MSLQSFTAISELGASSEEKQRAARLIVSLLGTSRSRDYIHRNIADIRPIPNQSFTQEYLKRLISAVASAVPPLRLIIINRQITRYASGVLQVAM